MSVTSNPIYKVNHLTDENTIKTIYVFFGNNLDVPDPNDLFKRDPRNIVFKNIFNDEELEIILDNTKPINVVFSKQQIHIDDTIGTIKIKILSEFSNTFSLEQIYLFCMKEEMLNPTSVYQTLTQNNRLELTRVRLDQFLMNINRKVNGEKIDFNIPEKEIYTYDDILELNLLNKFWISKVLGQKFFIVSNEYPFICNPFHVVEYDPFIERASRKSLTTLNSHLLLNSGQIVENNIYLCLANDVLLNAKNKNLSQDITTNIYYPFLSNRNIHSYEELEQKKYELLEDNKRLLNKNTTDNFDNINLFYDIYKYKEPTKKFKYKESGIKFVKLTIKPEFNIKIPLDIIFKIIHATNNNPLIKFNPTKRQENVYRLYADKLSKDGRKIPYLQKGVIFKLMRDIGKSKSVSIYFNEISNVSLLTCDFEENGNVSVTCEYDKIESIENVETLIKNKVNPLIQEVNKFLEQNGYSINIFNNIYDNNIEIKKMDYQTNVEITKQIKLDELVGCITSIFIIETKNLKDKNGMNMRFKRVANFNKMTSQEAFVIEQASQKDGLKGIEIVSALMENYQMTQEEANALLVKVASEIEVERGVKRNDIEVKMNPGFKTNIKLNPNTSIISIHIENINDIYYLNTIPIYLDSFIRITQDKSSTKIPINTINSLCNTYEKEDIFIADIVAPSEQSFPNQENPTVEHEEFVFEDLNNNEPKFKSAIDLIYGDDDYEEDEDASESSVSRGGKGSSLLSDNSKNSLSGEFFTNVKLPSSNENSLSSFGDSLSEGSKGESIVISAKEFEDSLSSTGSSTISSVSSPSSSPSSTPRPTLNNPIHLNNTEKNKKLVEENNVRDIVGLSLKNPSPFLEKMYKTEPILFLKEDRGKFNGYSRSCSSNVKKQPVLITPEELQDMKDEEYEKVLEKYGKEVFESFPKEKQEQIIKDESFLKEEDIIKYGTNKEYPNYYICPRYWCLKTNKPIDPSEMIEVIDKTGKKVKRHPTCGGIIPNSQNVIKNDGNYVYEFFNATEHGTQENYKKHYPGFLGADKHPDGLCVPCCFSKWNTPKQMIRKAECAHVEDKIEQPGHPRESTPENVLIESVSEKTVKKIVEKDNYVKGPEKFPLEKGRWGYLQVSVQTFFQEAALSCQISKTNTNVKPNHTCLLRHGIEFNENQSFIACISDAKYYGESSVPSIKEMKKIIVDAISIDEYITSQNGNNVISFMIDGDMTNIDVSKYSSSNLYKYIYNSERQIILEQDSYFKKIVSSFENFQKYLLDDNTLIDYTYLWDIICKPNPQLFPQGINLIILEIVNNDTTNNIDLICPTNHYSNEFYNPLKQTLFIIKNDNLYEPIYTYENKVKSVKVSKTFSEHNKALSPSLRAIFKKIIKPILKDICSPLPSMPTVYKVKPAIKLSKVVNILNSKDYKIIKQVFNYQNKIIALFVSKNNQTGYVPCYPSSLDSNYPDFTFMDDPSIYNNYEKTVSFLKKLNTETKGSLHINPEFKVIEDQMVVGIITETNQFIQLSEPFPLSNVTDNIPQLDNENYVVNNNKALSSSEYSITTSNTVDTERVKYIKRIKLETNFYNVFRNTIRILFNNYENIKMREKVEKDLNENFVLYNAKLYNTINNLKELVKDTIIFTDDYDFNLIKEISTCLVIPRDKCESNRPVCAITSNKCQLIIPKKNLLNDTIDNEKFYFGKMADELIRYNRIKSVIFKPQTYLSFGEIKYNLKENEIIVIQSILTKDYFDGLIPEPSSNNYIKYNNYDTTEPIITQVYDNNVLINGDKIRSELQEDSMCNPVVTDISSLQWKKCFPSTFKEFYYDKNNCGFHLLSNIIQKFNGKKLEMNDIKNDLLSEYNIYYDKYKQQILDILVLEGKNMHGAIVKQKGYTFLAFQHFIFSDDYFITNLDIWMIANKYKIPTIIISTKPIIITNKLKNDIVLYGSVSDQFVFIYSPALRSDSIPKYSVIQSNNNIFLSLDVLQTQDCLRSITQSIEDNKNIEDFLQTFTKQKIPKKKLTGKIVIEDNSEPKPQSIIIEPQQIIQPEIIAQPEKKTRKQKTFVLINKPKTKKKKIVIEE